MKFGKLFKEKQAAGWDYIDYKRLKQLLKEGTSAAFQKELWDEIATVNAAFLEEERNLMSQLSVHTAGERESSRFFDEVRQLYRSGVLNYIACLKIVKKHDKRPGVEALRTQARSRSVAAQAAPYAVATAGKCLAVDDRHRC